MAATAVACRHPYCFSIGSSCIRKVSNEITSKPFHSRTISLFQSLKTSSLPANLTIWHYEAAPLWKEERAIHVEAKSKKEGKPDNGGEKVRRFGPLFANGSTGIDCPVPSEQQPINEYQNLVESVPFSWAVGDIWVYSLRLSAIGAAVAVLLGWPVVTLSVNPEEEFIKCGLGAFCGGLLAVSLATLRMYLGWAYVGNRLFSATVEYEETGWYDGDVWIKPLEVLARDRLLGSYKVKPALNRVKLTLLGLAASLATCAFLFLSLHNPQDSSIYLKTVDDSLEPFYGGTYNDASARIFEPEAFEGENEQSKLPDYCY